MQAEGAGEEPVSEGDMDDVVFGDPRGGHESGRQFGPGLQIVPGIADHRRLAGGPRGGMDPHHLTQRDGEHAVGIIEAQIFLGGKGQAAQVGESSDICRG